MKREFMVLRTAGDLWQICLWPKILQNTEWYLRPGPVPIFTRLFFSRFSRCRRKLRLRGEGMICRDPKKVDFFQFLIIPNMPTYAVPER